MSGGNFVRSSLAKPFSSTKFVVTWAYDGTGYANGCEKVVLNTTSNVTHRHWMDETLTRMQFCLAF
jgi:hypothetical protein